MKNQETFALQMQFADGGDVPIQFANVVGVQAQLDSYILNFGQVAPYFTGTREEQRQQAAKMGILPVSPIARFGFSRSTAELMFRQLGEALGYLPPTEESDADRKP
jgi:hypothetical protein